MTELQEKRSVEVCFSPALFEDILTTGDFIVVLVDVLRATTTICTAVANGVEAIIPVATHEEARRLKSEGYLVASEKDGVQLDWADFGNSALSFTRDAIGGKTLVYCTTNGTRALHIAGAASSIAIGAFINISALTEWLAAAAEERGRPVLGLEEQVLPRGHPLRRGADGQTAGDGPVPDGVRLGSCVDGPLGPGRRRRAGLHREGRAAPPPEEAGAGRRDPVLVRVRPGGRRAGVRRERDQADAAD